jgi:NTP pyrophosphatase (non-canonical NTP hydrolase)
MEFRTIQEDVVKNALEYGKKYNVTIDKEFALLKLFEEAGELAQAVLIHEKKSRPEKHLSAEESKKDLASEIADLVGMALVCAHLYGVDLESALERKWISRS